jgi:hypothetical protein
MCDLLAHAGPSINELGILFRHFVTGFLLKIPHCNGGFAEGFGICGNEGWGDGLNLEGELTTFAALDSHWTSTEYSMEYSM